MKHYLKLTCALTLGLSAVGTATLADGHGKALADSVNARHAQMQLISYNIGILGEMAKGAVPYDSAVAASAATNLKMVSALDRTVLWLEGTEQGAIADSRAKTEIWSDAAGFDEKAKQLESSTAALADAAGTDLDALRGAIGAVGDSCGACHKAYRGPKN